MTASLPAWAQWIVAFAPIGTLLIAVSAAAVGWRTLSQGRDVLRQRQAADARTHWWDRTKWAIEWSLSDDPDVSDVGIEVLMLQIDSKLSRDEEATLMEAIFDPILKTLERRGAGDVSTRRGYLVGNEPQAINEGGER